MPDDDDELFNEVIDATCSHYQPAINVVMLMSIQFTDSSWESIDQSGVD